jgi:hypothetical protein
VDRGFTICRTTPVNVITSQQLIRSRSNLIVVIL